MAIAVLWRAEAASGNPVQPGERLELTVTVTGLKNDQGRLRYCIAPRGGGFPQCSGEGSLSGNSAIAGGSSTFVLRDLRQGSYAIAVFHDQNGNNRLDTMIGIPREGYGFSRNPGFKPRAPRFNEASLDLSQSTRTEIRIRYIL